MKFKNTEPSNHLSVFTVQPIQIQKCSKCDSRWLLKTEVKQKPPLLEKCLIILSAVQGNEQTATVLVVWALEERKVLVPSSATVLISNLTKEVAAAVLED